MPVGSNRWGMHMLRPVGVGVGVGVGHPHTGPHLMGAPSIMLARPRAGRAGKDCDGKPDSRRACLDGTRVRGESKTMMATRWQAGLNNKTNNYHTGPVFQGRARYAFPTRSPPA